MMEVKKTPELLAPAGGLEQLQYALHFGADAVYCALDRFGLRQRADNFSLEALPEVVSMVHQAGAKIFVTCNAYMNAEDLKELPRYLEVVQASGVDALILSDMGALRLAKQYAPKVACHISTQASCSNAEAARMYHDMGAQRIVCAREMSLGDIATMKAEIPQGLELEVFVHGAMCMAISGRCLISDFMTDRSANRGHCTQPCRWEYELHEPTRPGEAFPLEEDERGSYLMNSKDLCMLEHLDDVVATGVDSLKIEGRNKKAFYVATIVNAYRQVLDGVAPQELRGELDIVSHRPYSTGFFYGSAEQTIGHGEYAQSADWVGEVLEDAREGRVRVRCRNRFYQGDVLEVLSPGQPIREVAIDDLCLEYSDGSNEPVETACRTMDTYSFATGNALQMRDILRARRTDPQKKN